MEKISNFFIDCNTRDPNDCDDDNQQDDPQDNQQAMLGARNTAMRDAVIQQIYARYETKSMYISMWFPTFCYHFQTSIVLLPIIRINNFVSPSFLQL